MTPNPTKSLTSLIRPVCRTGRDEIAHLFSQIAERYGHITNPTDDERTIIQSAWLAACHILPEHPVTHERREVTLDDDTIARNVLRLCIVPATHITLERRATCIGRAILPEDVYCYKSQDAWYLWDIDTRICLPPLASILWVLDDAHQIEDAMIWQLLAHRVDTLESATITIHIAHAAMDTTPASYQARARRVIQNTMGHVAKWGEDFTEHNNTHH